MSDWKNLLRFFAAASIASLVVQLALFLEAAVGRITSNAVLGVAAVVVVLTLWTFAMLLVAEFVRAARTPSTWLSPREQRRVISAFPTLIRWCPGWLAIFLLGAVGAVLMLTPSGKVFWEFGTPMASDVSLKFLGVSVVFVAVVVPIFVSAARMPGSYKSNLSTGV
ncbi:hypothetical protein [Solimonas sp. SE-A11]|uniref:hypothetical protein n=1 Tax=Solimonas sp. SE-A11 TaxID=3054954 RepID=UPI00259C9B92|nr:hypothetical protein [Solimonas sp. SE-A11]MDM4770920.1 hypothetical protein [Solimonas sp. SE-A11]